MESGHAAATARRTQEERSAETRVRLFDATIDCLLERGYTGTTTTEVARRAGVSRGAQVHHFPTKGELVERSIDHLARRMGEELEQEVTSRPAVGDRASVAIDVLWSGYTGPLFPAALELMVAARTDPGLVPAVEALERTIRRRLEVFCREVLGADPRRSRPLRDALELTISIMQGLALDRVLHGERDHLRLLGVWKRLARPLFGDGVRD